MKKIYKVLILVLALCIFIYAIFRITPYPQLNQFKTNRYSTRVYDCNNNLLQVLPLDEGLRREWTDYEEIPQNIITFFLASEDKRFFRHNGVDYSAIFRAIGQNIKSRRTVRGASTITMQLVRIIDSESAQKKRTVWTKLAEAFNAHRLEVRLSKKQILELYLNNVPFGMNCEGVTSAARTFFGKQLNELTEKEIACLAIIPRRPSDNNPFSNPELCAQKAQELYKNVKGAETTIDLSMMERYSYPFEMPHYINYLKDKISDLPEVHLTASLNLQKYSQDIALKALESAEDARISNASILVIDNENNSVLAWVGNANWYDEDNSGQVDGVLVRNQPGSSMKPFLYALGLETEYKPTSVLADVPKEFGDSNVYIPANFNNRFNGPVRYRVALASSLNIPAVTVLDTVGVDSYLDVLEKLGFESLKEKGKDADLGLALGAGEVGLNELVPAFSTFVRDGVYFPLTYLKNELPQNPVTVYQRDTSRIICDFLSDKSARAKGFGYTQTFETDYPSIFKTGTSNQYQNIIALGATKRWTVGVWMGNFSGETVVGKTGSSLPASIAKQILDYLYNSKDDLYFPLPEEYELCPVCSVSGMLASDSCPSKVYEYVKKGDYISSCDWHNKVTGEVTYPSEYQQWFRLAKRTGLLNYQDSDLTVLTPRNNSIFYYDSGKKDKLAIHFELSGGYSDSLIVKYDGEYYATVYRPFTLEIPITRGKHTVQFSCGLQMESISYEVK